LAWHFSEQDAEVSFAAPGHPRTRDLHEFLAQLAVIEPRIDAAEKGTSPVDPLHEMNIGNSDEYNIVVTARPRGSVPTALWNCSYFVFATDQT
jgi:hypothetical protein